MTVAETIRALADLLIAGEVRPDDPVVREWGGLDVDGHADLKQVMFADVVWHAEWPPAAIEGGLDHPTYGKDGMGKPVRLVRLD